jgi:hypothetical protein
MNQLVKEISGIQIITTTMHLIHTTYDLYTGVTRIFSLKIHTLKQKSYSEQTDLEILYRVSLSDYFMFGRLCFYVH